MTTPTVLLYHRIAVDPVDAQSLCVRPGYFEAHLRYLRANRTILPLTEFTERWVGSSLPADAVAITFDDGYADNLSIASPLLAEHSVPATVFVVAGWLGSVGGLWGDFVERMFFCNPSRPAAVRAFDEEFDLTSADGVIRAHDRVRYRLQRVSPDQFRKSIAALAIDLRSDGSGEPNRPILSPDQLIALSHVHGISLGAHTLNHRRLSVLSIAEQSNEIKTSRQIMRELTGCSIDFFAYPYGDDASFDHQSVQLCQEAGFDGAVTTSRTAEDRSMDPFRLPRIVVRDWPGELFARWLEDDCPAAELEVFLASRNERLRELLRSNKGCPL